MGRGWRWLSPVFPRSSQAAPPEQAPPAGAARGPALQSPPGPRPRAALAAGQPLAEPAAPRRMGTPHPPGPPPRPSAPCHPLAGCQPSPGASAAPQGPFGQVRCRAASYPKTATFWGAFGPIPGCRGTRWLCAPPSVSLSLQDTGATAEVPRSTQHPRLWGHAAGTHPVPAGPRHTGQCGGPRGATWEHPGDPPFCSSTGQGQGPQCPESGTATSKNHPARGELVRGGCQAAASRGPCCRRAPCPQPHQGQGQFFLPAPRCPGGITEQEKPLGRDPGSRWTWPSSTTPKFFEPSSKRGQKC